MNFVKTKISLLFREWTDSENEILKQREKEDDPKNEEFIEQIKGEREKIYSKLEEMENYYKVFKKIEESPESYLDLSSALELIKVMGFPSLFAIISAILSFYL
jgi:hypothetical protein